MSFAPDLKASTNPDLDLLIDIHRFKRPKGSRTEQLFIETFLLPLGVKQDLYGNLHKVVAPEGAPETYMPSVIWSSHTDTVHTSDGFQRVEVDANGMMRLAKREDASCLGADDGAGVWLMMEMIRAGIPGWYIFHYGEEKGCEGSTKLSLKHPAIFKDIQIAIAFDRRFCGDVITHMGSTRVCSDAFAESLILQLPANYKKDTGGSSTDVGKYKTLIPECTNLSVGYYEPHMKTERLDTKHLIDLRDHLLKLDVSKLVVKRDPKVVENLYAQHGRHTHHTSYNNDAWKQCRPRSFKDLFKDAPDLCEEMMKEAGIDFEVFLSLAIKQQAKKIGRHYTSVSREVIAYDGFKDPIPGKDVAKAEPKTEAKTETKATPAVSGTVGATGATGATESNVVPMQQQGRANVPAPINGGTD